MTQNSADLEAFRHELGKVNLPTFARLPVNGTRIVALEGPNGAGKTTLGRRLSETLDAPFCLGTDEAWFSRTFKTRMIRDADWFASAMFFLSGCFEQTRLLRKRVEPLIVLDRCLWSTLAVHTAEDESRLGRLVEMLRPLAAEIFVPHLTIVLDASFATCQKRIAEKQGEARALDELTATEGFHRREKEFYRWLSKQSSAVAFVEVDRKTPEQVAEAAVQLIRGHTC